MWHSKQDASGGHAGQRKVKQRVDKPDDKRGDKRSDSRIDVTVEPDPGFLNDPGIQYPVVIDPAVTVWTSFDTFTQASIANTDQSGMPELRIGTFDGGATKARSYLHFDVSAFRGTRILSSRLWLYEFWSYSCSARDWEVWDTALVGTGTRWSNQPNPF